MSPSSGRRNRYYPKPRKSYQAALRSVMGWTGRNDDKRYEEFREFVTQLAKKHLDISKITTEQEDRILLIQKKISAKYKNFSLPSKRNDPMDKATKFLRRIHTRRRSKVASTSSNPHVKDDPSDSDSTTSHRSSSLFRPENTPPHSGNFEQGSHENRVDKGKQKDDRGDFFQFFSDHRPSIECWHERMTVFGVDSIPDLKSFSKWSREEILEVLNDLAQDKRFNPLSTFQVLSFARELKRSPLLQ